MQNKKSIRMLCSVAFLLIGIGAGTADGQIFVADFNNGVIGKYNLDGTPVNTSLISGLQGPYDLASDGNGHLFVLSRGLGGRGYVGEYNLDGSPVNVSLISGLQSAQSMALDGNGHIFIGQNPLLGGYVSEFNLNGTPVNTSLITHIRPICLEIDGNGHIFIADNNGNGVGGYVREYTTSGLVINPTLIGGLNNPIGLALDGDGHLFVANNTGGYIGEYTISGETVNASLISGLNNLGKIALDGNGHLLVGNDPNGTPRVSEYSTGGTLVNNSFIAESGNPISILVVPEPSVVGLVSVGLTIFYRRKRQ